jgi:hypothetical protein
MILKLQESYKEDLLIEKDLQKLKENKNWIFSKNTFIELLKIPVSVWRDA